MAADETSPLLQNGAITPKTAKAAKTVGAAIFGPANRILLAGFLMSFTLGITQVPVSRSHPIDSVSQY